jgi:hypothetical protein
LIPNANKMGGKFDELRGVRSNLAMAGRGQSRRFSDVCDMSG